MSEPTYPTAEAAAVAAATDILVNESLRIAKIEFAAGKNRVRISSPEFKKDGVVDRALSRKIMEDAAQRIIAEGFGAVPHFNFPWSLSILSPNHPNLSN